jgi:flagellar motility protein MotE (MotC chaperone)
MTVLAILMALEIAASAALAGYYILTGKVTAEQARLVYKVYQGEVKEQALENAQKWTREQEENARKTETVVAGADAQTKLAASSEQIEVARLAMDRQYKELQDRQAMADRKLQDIEQKRKGLEEIEKRIDDKVAKEKEGTDQQSFQKMLAIMKGMKPPQLKEILVQMDDAATVEVLKGLEARASAKVLAEFKTPQELERKRRYLDMIRTGEVASNKATVGG